MAKIPMEYAEGGVLFVGAMQRPSYNGAEVYPDLSSAGFNVMTIDNTAPSIPGKTFLFWRVISTSYRCCPFDIVAATSLYYYCYASASTSLRCLELYPIYKDN